MKKWDEVGSWSVRQRDSRQTKSRRFCLPSLLKSTISADRWRCGISRKQLLALRSNRERFFTKCPYFSLILRFVALTNKARFFSSCQMRRNFFETREKFAKFDWCLLSPRERFSTLTNWFGFGVGVRQGRTTQMSEIPSGNENGKISSMSCRNDGNGEKEKVHRSQDFFFHLKRVVPCRVM